MSYSDFIKSIYNCIKAYSGIRDFSCSVFADGPERLDNIYRASQENAVLRNEYAEKFAGVINVKPDITMFIAYRILCEDGKNVSDTFDLDFRKARNSGILMT